MLKTLKNNYKEGGSIGNKGKRFISILLVFMFVFSLLPSNLAFAEENDGSELLKVLAEYKEYNVTVENGLLLYPNQEVDLGGLLKTSGENTDNVKWKVSKDNVIDLSVNGKVIAKSDGDVVVSAEINNNVYLFEIYVQNPETRQISRVLGYSSLGTTTSSYRVYIDPGHGGEDSGAVNWSKNLQEKDINLKMGLDLKSKLESQGFEVKMSRYDDRFVALRSRVDDANQWNADVFVSIHQNSASSTNAYGIETWSSPDTSRDNKNYATVVQSNLIKSTGAYDRGVFGWGYDEGNLVVTKYTTMPAALVETGFISNPSEAENMKNPAYIDKVTTGIKNGINGFLGFDPNNPSDITPKLTLESPKNNAEIINSDLVVTGTVTNARTIKYVRFYFDGAYWSDVPIINGRFTYTLPKSRAGYGLHKVRTEITNPDGQIQRIEANIQMKATASTTLINLNSPKDNESIIDSDIVFEGTVINQANNQYVKVYLDGTKHSTADIVNGSFKYVLPKENVGYGDHKVMGEVDQPDGTVQRVEKAITLIPPPVLTLATPKDNEEILDKDIVVTGTVSNPGDNKYVRFYFDNAYWSDVPIVNGNFTYTLPKTRAGNGIHKIRTEITLPNGTAQKIERTVTLKTPTPELVLATPKDNEEILDKDIVVTGTVTNPGNTKYVRFYFNNSYWSDLPIVNGNFSYTLPKTRAGNGIHKIRTEITLPNGTIQRIERTVTLKSPTPMLTLNTPKDNEEILDKDIVVTGTVSNPGNTKYVRFYFNNSYWSDLPIVNGNFSYTLPKTRAGNGIHKIRTEITLPNGTIQRIERTVTLKIPVPVITISSLSNNENIIEKDIVIQGRVDNPGSNNYVRFYFNNIYWSDIPIVNGTFSYTLPKSRAGYGTHSIRTEVNSPNGGAVKNEIVVNLKPPTPVLNLVSPQSNETVIERNIEISGTVSNPGSNKYVRLYVNDSYWSDVLIVDGSFKYSLNKNSIPYGINKIRTEINLLDGQVQKIERIVNLKEIKPEVTIESPSANVTVRDSRLTITGYAINKSVVQEVKFYLDGSYYGGTVALLPRSDLNNTYQGYNAATISGYMYSINTSKVSTGTHTITVEAIGYNGSKVSKTISFNMFGVITYRSMPNKFSFYVDEEYYYGKNKVDNTSISASREQIEYCLNPNNYINDANGKYMFLKLTYFDGVSANDLNKVLEGKGVLQGKGSVFLEAGRTYNVNPIYLVAHSLLETGNGGSRLANGINVTSVDGSDVTPKTVYNVFGIGAYDADANRYGSERAYKEGWTTVDKAIVGGAQFISQTYIRSQVYKQDTLYKMKWDLGFLERNDGSTSPWHQYATDIYWPYKQTFKIKEIIDQMQSPVLQFEVPNFN